MRRMYTLLLIFPYSTFRTAHVVVKLSYGLFLYLCLPKLLFYFLVTLIAYTLTHSPLLAARKPCAGACIMHADRNWSRINTTLGCSVSTQGN
jgi:hypothetical protein